MHRSFEAAQALGGLIAPSSRVSSGTARFCLEELAGRLVEMSGDSASAVLTLAVGLVLDAQAAREPVAWVGSDESSFYPPDLADSGVDLAALIVVRIAAAALQNTRQPRSHVLAVAAERLLRSGAFGLVVVDLGADREPAQGLQSRLLGLAQRHHAALVCLTEKSEETPSLGSLVSLRVHAVRSWLGRDRFACELRVRKDKRRGPVWSEREVYRGPLGLR
jgi:recombination protein RecA